MKREKSTVACLFHLLLVSLVLRRHFFSICFFGVYLHRKCCLPIKLRAKGNAKKRIVRISKMEYSSRICPKNAFCMQSNKHINKYRLFLPSLTAFVHEHVFCTRYTPIDECTTQTHPLSCWLMSLLVYVSFVLCYAIFRSSSLGVFFPHSLCIQFVYLSLLFARKTSKQLKRRASKFQTELHINKSHIEKGNSVCVFCFCFSFLFSIPQL